MTAPAPASRGLPAREECIAAASAIASTAWAEMTELAATQGPEAVAEAAWKPGGPSREEIADQYGQWVQDGNARSAMR